MTIPAGASLHAPRQPGPLAGLLVAAALAPPAAAFAQAPVLARTVRVESLTPTDVLAIARNLVDAGRCGEAQSLLDRLAADGMSGPEWDFLGAMAAICRKDYPRAEALLHKILRGDPSLVRVRLELARTLFFERKDEDADYHFKLAVATHPPGEVIANIARFREAIRARRAWRFNVTFGVAPDSNINAATDKERVDVLGLPFVLDPSARARSGTGIVAGGEASIRLRRSSRVPLYLAVQGRMLRYPEHRFNDVYIGAEAGPEFRLSGWRMCVAATAFHRWYGGDRLAASIGGRLHLDKIISGRWGIDASLAARHNAYAHRRDVNGWDFEAALSANRALSPSMLGFAYAAIQRSTARDPGQSHWQGRMGIGAVQEIGWGLRPQLSIEVSRQVHDAALGLFGTTRRDWRLQASAGLYKHDWNLRGFAPSLRVTYTRNFSTIGLYDQKRLRGEVGVTRAF